MALRLIEMACPEEKRQEVDELVGQFDPLGVWHDQLLDRQVLVMVLVQAEKAEAVLDRLESTYGQREGFRVLLMEVQAAVPRPAPTEAERAAASQPKFGPARISRQELDAEVRASARLNGVFLAMILLSSLVAAIGMWRDNAAVIIGAMVIAPLLGPNIALAFATALGNVELGLRALKTALAGIGAALLVAVLLGLVLPIEGGPERLASGSELLLRTHAGLADIVLALAAGTAGALAFTTGIHTPLVGVMVAVALLPPLVASGLCAGAGPLADGAGGLPALPDQPDLHQPGRRGHLPRARHPAPHLVGGGQGAQGRPQRARRLAPAAGRAGRRHRPGPAALTPRRR